MFEINVQREAIEQRRAARQRFIKSFLLRSSYLAILMLLVGLFTFRVFSLSQNIRVREKEMQEMEQTMERYAPEGKSISADKLLVLARIKGSRIKWGDKLERLCTLLPAHIWIREISLKDYIIEGVSHDAFVISASAYLQEEHEGLNVVLGFLNELRTDETFSQGLSNIDLLSSKRSMTLEKKQLDFEFVCPIR
jgi:hypothetical protein